MAHKAIGIGMIGCGTVGGGVARLLSEQAKLYTQRVGRAMSLRKVLVRDVKKAGRADCIDPTTLTDDAEAFFADDSIDIVIEVAGGRGAVSEMVQRALKAGKHVITANKALLAAEGPALFALARENDVSIACEASCAGGIPVVTALQFGLMANRIDALYGILNGTCNYILTEMTQHDKSYSVALDEAQHKGFAEADPVMDVSGRDAAEKLAILASLGFGVSATSDDVWSQGIDELQLDDIRFGKELGYDIKLLGIAERVDGTKLSLRVHPAFISNELQLAQVHGSFNALSVYGHATGHTMYFGRGAGEMPTASAVVSDLLNVVSGWYPQACRNMNLLVDQQEPVDLVDADDLVSRFYIRIMALDVPGVMAQVSRILGDAGISLGALLQHESEPGEFVPVVVNTHEARQGALLSALKEVEALDTIQGSPVCIRIVDMPKG